MKDERSLLEEYVTARDKVEEIKLTLREANENLQKCENSLRLFMEDNGIESTSKYEDLGRFSLGNPIINVKFDRSMYPLEYAVKWCVDNGFEDAVQRTVHHSTLGALVRSVIEEGKPVPEFFQLSTFRPSNFQRS